MGCAWAGVRAAAGADNSRTACPDDPQAPSASVAAAAAATALAVIFIADPRVTVTSGVLPSDLRIVARA
jgi:hypothetical protein